MGCRTVRPRSPSGFFLKRRSKSLPVIFCVPRRAIASRHSDSILQEESCLEMFIIFKKNGDKDLWDLEDWNYRISLPWQHLDFFNPIHHRFPSANSQIVPFDLVRLLYWSPFLSSRISVRNLPQIYRYTSNPWHFKGITSNKLEINVLQITRRRKWMIHCVIPPSDTARFECCRVEVSPGESCRAGNWETNVGMNR